MAIDVGQAESFPPAHRVTWFVPDRPTGGTVFVIPADAPVAAADVLPHEPRPSTAIPSA